MVTADLKQRVRRATIADMGHPPKDPDRSTYRGRMAYNLRSRRLALGLTVKELVEVLEAQGDPLTSHALYKYETGERPVTVDDLPKLAKALKTTPHDLLPKK